MKKLIFVFTLIAVLCSCSSKKTAVTPKELYYDIESIKVDMVYSSLKDVYDPAPFEQLQKEVLDGTVDRDECVGRLRKIVSSYKSGHLYIIDNSKEYYEKFVPIGFYCFDEGYYVHSARSLYKKYLGWKLTGIGNYSIDEALKIAVDYLPLETPAGEKYCFENIGLWSHYYQMGFTSKGKLSFTLESPEGKTKTIKVRPKNSLGNYYNLLPENTTVFNKVHERKNNYEFMGVPETRTLYVPYNSAFPREDYKVNDFFADMVKELQTQKYDTIVFDLRYNPGGEALMMENSLYRHKEELEKYNIAMITTGRTYSAATHFMDQVLRMYPHARIFGEETGQAVFNYTGVYKNNVLKKLNITYCWPGWIAEAPELYARSKDIHRGTMPDVEVGETLEGYLNGEDSIYRAIYEYYNK